MADKVQKPKKQKAKPSKEEKSVLAALPATRSQRIGARRSAGAPAKPAVGKPAAARGAAAKPAAAKPAAARGAAAKPAAAKPAAAEPTAAKPAAPRAAAARREAAAPHAFEPTPAAEAAAAGAADERAAGGVPRAETPPEQTTPYPRPRPVREGAPGIGTPGYREQQSSKSSRPNGVELVSTAVRAADKLAQIGITIGGQILKRVANRVPKP